MELDVTLNRTSPIPLYHQLAAQLEAAIETGALPRGTFLGNEVDLANRWQVSRPTVRRAIQELVGDGLIVRRRGVGSQVVNDQVRRPIAMSSFHDDLVAAGHTPVTRVVTLERSAAPPDIADDLRVGRGDELVEIVRVRLSGGRPLAVMRNWLIVDVGGELTIAQLERDGLYPLIRQRGVRPHSAFQRLGAKAASVEEAAMLDLVTGAPLVTMRRVMQDDTGRAIEVGDHVYDADNYSVEMSVVES